MNSISIKLGAIVIGILAVVAYFGWTTTTFGAPSQITSRASGTTATTSVISWMTVGAGTTTTPVYDSQQSDGTNQTNSGNTWATDSAVFAMQVNASSTLSVFNITFEYADGSNCGTTPAACDWYGDSLWGDASTTNPIGVRTNRSISWVFASSSIGGVISSAGQLGINGTNNRDSKVFEVKTPMRWVRAVISVTGANGAVVGATFIPKKQVK